MDDLLLCGSSDFDVTGEVSSILTNLSSGKVGARNCTPLDSLALVRKLIDLTGMETMEPLLPLLLAFNGKPLTLKNHFVLSPLFTTREPSKTVFMNGRQTGKSVGVASALYLTSVTKPNLSSLYVTPLQEQMKRFSLNYMQSLINNSPFRPFLSKGCTQTINQRGFVNDSKILFSFASDNADRVRGINADVNCYDEVQDFSFDVLPVIAETLSASISPRTLYTGTPKTEDNTLSHLWRRSSQAEWWIPCTHCGFENIPSKEYHLERMIGPSRDDISEENPAVICYKCRKPIYPRLGRWVHRFPNRRMSTQYGTGYHVPQILLPMHYSNKLKWDTLLAKQDDWPTALFLNEVLGEPVDSGQTLVSMRDLQAAGCLGYRNNPNSPDEQVFRLLNSHRYESTCLAIDWGGGGQEMISFTCMAIMGIDYDGNIDVLWGKRFTAGIDHAGEAEAALAYLRAFSPQLVVHDYSGPGVLRETIMHQAGVPLNRIMGIIYTGPSKQAVIRHIPATAQHPRDHYSLDKSRSLLYTIQMLKTGKLRFFEYDGGSGSKNAAGMSTSLMDDFLALYDEKMTSSGSGFSYTIRRVPSKADDFAQTINFGCAALWHVTGHYPKFEIYKLQDSQSLARNIADAGPEL